MSYKFCKSQLTRGILLTSFFSICMGELYGLFATFVPEWLYQSPNLDASTFLYSWIYLGSNVPWAIIPLILTAQSTAEICKSFQRSKDFDRKRPQPQTSG
jgi:hypothetical protein